MTEGQYQQLQAWLQARGYRPTTVGLTLQQVRHAERLWLGGAGAPPAHSRASLRRLATWLRAEPHQGRGPFERAVLGRPELADVAPLRERAGRQRAALSHPEDEWQRLVAAVNQDTSASGVVLAVMCATGHRVGDILRIPRVELQAARRSGTLTLERKGGARVEVALAGAPEAWARLIDGVPPTAATVGDWVCPRCSEPLGRGAYRRVQRHLAAVGQRLGLSGRLHLHRLRRTVGVRALRATKDVHLVQQLLGHRSVQTTELYVDELRRDDLIELQKKLAGQ